MKTSLALLLVAGLFAATAALAAPATASPMASASAVTAAAAPDTLPPPAASEQPGTPAPDWVIACVPTCAYYQSFCTEICGTRGIKSFSCTPAIYPSCAHYSCTCNGFPL